MILKGRTLERAMETPGIGRHKATQADDEPE